MGLLDFNKQLEVVPKPGRGAITNPPSFNNKTDVFP
jgi:lipoprotein-releasing system permease protein